MKDLRNSPEYNQWKNEVKHRDGNACRHNAITKGQNWAAIRMALKSWILEKSQYLEFGRHDLNTIIGIPFQLTVDKQKSKNPRVIFSRSELYDDTLSCRIRELFDRKAGKLEKYQKSGKTTVLLVESSDIALMDIQGRKILNAILKAYPFGIPVGVDRIWYVDTADLPDWISFKDFTPELLKR